MRLSSPCLAALAVAALLGGCAGGGSNLTPPSSPLAPAAASAKHARGSARIVIRIPRKKRAAHYLSPATQSMTVAIAQGSKQVYTKTVNLTPTSSGCSSTLASTTCSLTILLGAGSYTASIATFDATNGTGKKLSAAQNVAFKIVKGRSNPIPLTLSGIPASLLVTKATANSVYVLAQDPDGNFIVGSGAPTFTAARTAGGTVATIVQPTAAFPNKISFTPVTSAGGTETIGITASFPKGTNGCALTGAACTSTDAVRVSYGQTLFVSNYSASNVLGYTTPLVNAQLPSYSLSAIAPFPIVLDANDDLFVAEYATSGGHLYEFKPPYANTPSAANAVGLSNPYGMATDSSGEVFVANTPGTVSVYDAPYTAAPLSISAGLSTPYAVAVDAGKNLYVANETNKTVTVYPPPYDTATPVTVTTTATPYSVYINGTNLYVGETAAIDVFSLSTPLTNASTPAVTLTTGVSEVYSMTLDASGNLFATNYDGGVPGYGSVTKYTLPLHTGEAPAVTLTLNNTPTGSTYDPYTVVFDSVGNMYVVNVVGGDLGGGILEYAPPITSSSLPAATIATANLYYPYFGVLTKSKTLSINP